MTSRLEKCVPTLRVRDASAACRYFCERLGFEKDWEHRFEPELPLFVSVSRDGVSLHLSEHTGDGPREVRVYVYVQDPRALFDELQSRGARIVAEPELQSYGTLEFIVEDLDGNRMRFGKAGAT
ncbi:MAG: bleomycin resistance protein [Myxococcota bacterium]